MQTTFTPSSWLLRAIMLCTSVTLLAACQTLAGGSGRETSTQAQLDALKFDTSHRGAELDLSGFKPTFSDEFDTMTVTTATGNGPWYAPARTDFGGAKFQPPEGPKNPFSINDGKLVIRMQKDEKGKWTSGHMQTWNGKDKGFLQQYGYFEMRAKFPAGIGPWTGVWLHSAPEVTGKGRTGSEVDIVEAYAADPKGLHSTIHLWPNTPSLPGEIDKKWGLGQYVAVKGMFEDFHTYGALVTPTEMIFYYDRKELGRLPMLPEFRTPQYILVSLTLLEKNWRQAVGPYDLQVDYVKAWQNPAFIQ